MALKYAPFGSEIDLPFYTALSQSKIDHDKLDDSARTVIGLYEPRIVGPEDSCRMRVLGNALTSDDVPPNHIRAEGKIKNVNTIEDFKNSDKTAILHTAAKQIWDAINDGTIYSIPSLLSSFSVLSFANLKKYTFTYWFAFPALHSDPAWKMSDAQPTQLTGKDTTDLVEEVGTWKYGTDNREHGFFLAKRIPHISHETGPDGPSTPGTPGTGLSYKWVIGSLRQFESGFFRGVDPEDQFVAFVDPSTYPDNPGWMLRNLLVLIKRRFKLHKVQILSYRDVHSQRHQARSRIFLLETELGESETIDMPRVTGWERNGIGKLTAKVTNLAQYMDPIQLADQAVDLNLKLMKWRIAPDLNLQKIKETKCLLLGAGTLGSYVSRALMAWGVRKITFVDNATVSYSNPVRQPLFDHKDAADSAKKAYRAAEALTEIYPNVDSTGHMLNVPMLGHPVEDEANIRMDFETLQKLIEDHDVIFLLMDTRESRWLPTVMGKAAGKIVMNAALGFDTYVVMRHGVTASDGGPAALGCYFCNDVVAPGDSVKDQTLDQQCTVTRPGVAAMASNLLVEVLVSLLQHPKGAEAPAPVAIVNNSTASIDYERDPPEHPLGIVPHQIRGFLSTFQNKIISGQSYDCCSACSPKIVNEYNRNGWEFVKKALSDAKYVTELSGLAEVHRAAEAAAGSMDWDSEPDIGEDEGEGELL